MITHASVSATTTTVTMTAFAKTTTSISTHPTLMTLALVGHTAPHAPAMGYAVTLPPAVPDAPAATAYMGDHLLTTILKDVQEEGVEENVSQGVVVFICCLLHFFF